MWPLLLLFLVDSGWAQCNPSIVGRSVCGQVNGYTQRQKQWVTCLTDTYIRQKSGLRHLCVDRNATQCWYPCMAEFYNTLSGNVSSECSCQSGDQLPLVGVPVSLSCFSPPGNSCDWFQDCLIKKHPSCNARTNAYALTNAKKFCNLYHDHNRAFTPVGFKWIDAVRRCLQVSLVPLLRRWKNPTCQQIRAKAFDSHTPCYLSPHLGAPSICDLNCTEYLKVFWILKGSYSSLDTAGETLKGLWNTGMRCACVANPPSKNSEPLSNRSEPNVERSEHQFIMVTRVTVKKFSTRPRRSVDSIPESDLQQRFADGVSLAIARFLRWNFEAMDWFGFSDNSTDASDPDVSTFNLILADTKSLGIDTNPFSDQVNLNGTIQQLATAITEGKLPLRVDGAFVWVKSLQICQDTFCNSTETIAVSDTRPIWPTELTVTESNQTRTTTSGGTNLRYSTALLSSLLMFMFNMMRGVKQD